MSQTLMQPTIEVLPQIPNAVLPPRDALEDLQAELYNEVRAHGRPLKQLLTALLDRRNLYAAWRFVRSNEGADTPGPDGVTCKGLEQSGSNNESVTRLINDISESILEGRYSFKAPRWVDIPKPSGGMRRIGVLNVSDRVVHAALKQVLEPIFEPIFLPSSFAYRPGRSIAGALHAAVTWMKLGKDGQLIFPYAMHLDVADCFDTIDHEHLLDIFSQHVADEAVLNLLRQLLRASAHTVRRWFRWRYVGLLQGSPLSPLLCNLAMHQIDCQMKSLRSATQAGVAYYRYADDILVLARSEDLARKAFYCIKDALSDIHQALRVRKPPIVSLLDGVDWLGVRLRVTTNHWTKHLEAGYVVPDDAVHQMLQRLTEMTTPPSAKLSEQTFDLGQWILSLNQQLNGWYQTYQYADNIHEVARTLDEHVSRRFEEVLMAVTGRSRRYVQNTYLVRLPRGFRTWQVDGRRLVVLASEPPRRMTRISSRPPWMRPLQPPHAQSSESFFIPGTVTLLPNAAYPSPADSHYSSGATTNSAADSSPPPSAAGSPIGSRP